jgi:hypothetical protein
MKTIFVVNHADEMPENLTALLDNFTIGIEAAPGVAIALTESNKWLAVFDDGQALHFIASENQKPTLAELRDHVQFNKQSKN